MEYRTTVLRNRALRRKPGHLLDDREAKHVSGDPQSDESTGTDVAARQARAGPDQVSHRATSDRPGESGAERSRRLRDDLLSSGPVAHRSVRLFFVLLLLLLPLLGSVRGRVEGEADGGFTPCPTSSCRGNAAHGEATVRLRDNTLRSGWRRV